MLKSEIVHRNIFNFRSSTDICFEIFDGTMQNIKMTILKSQAISSANCSGITYTIINSTLKPQIASQQ